MKKGFTLSELLMALTIVGVIATLTVPVLMNNVHNKMFANQVKNMAATIEQLAQDELIAKRTRDLSDTDFGDPEKLLSDDHFSIAKSCTSDESLTKCWKTNATGKDKVTYKNLKRSGNPVVYDGKKTIILKNGVMLLYFPESGTNNKCGVFEIDVNGNDKPNMAGRDLFAFYIDTKGHIFSLSSLQNLTLQEATSKCKDAGDVFTVWHCYAALADNGWKMDY